MELLEFKDVKNVPDIIHPYTRSLRNSSAAIIIDNGSYQCRAGWSCQDRPLLTFRNLIAKPRKERSRKDAQEQPQTPQLQVGNNIVNIEAVRFQLKTQFDKNVVTHFEAQEHLLDYTFNHLGIDTYGGVHHPVVLTECLLNPNTSRQLMTELLFECYNVPGISYGVDCLLANQFYDPKCQGNALIVSLGYHTCEIVPVIQYETIFENIRRLNTGGHQVISFLHRILQLKYPMHANVITLSRAEELLHTICLVAQDYREELKKWSDSGYYDKNIKKIQLPYASTTTTSTLTPEQQKERKKELARRLSEINARKREERLIEDEQKLLEYNEMQQLLETCLDPIDKENLLVEMNLKSMTELQKNINNLTARIERTKMKISSMNNPEEVEEPPKPTKSTKMVFESDDALQAYLDNLRKMRQDILNRKLMRKQKKQDMAKRRTAAGQERMRIISQLARKEKGNDDFGLRDEDWDIYKTISKDAGDSDSDAENERIIELEDAIREYEPNEFDEVVDPGETHQLHIGVERYRAPELLFRPFMVGSIEAGLSEIIGYVLSLFSVDDQLALAANVIVVGGLAQLPGLQERLLSDLISIRPFRSEVNVRVLNNCQLAAWYGAKKWACSVEFKKKMFTRRLYEEYGSGYFVQHFASNLFYATPKSSQSEGD